MSSKDRIDHHSHLPEQRQKELLLEWETTLRVFRAFQTVAPQQRFHHLGLVFEHLSPWIERGIRGVIFRYFILLPTELALARLFAKAVRKEELPHAYETFLLWVEASVLQDIAELSDQIGATNCAVGEPSAQLQQRFNKLPFQDRALLYLYMVEKQSLNEVASQAGLTTKSAAAALNRIWRAIAGDDQSVKLPLGWQAPDNPLGG